MKQVFVYGAIALCLFVTVARSNAYSDEVTDLNPLDLELEDESNATSRIERQAPMAATLGGFPGGPIGIPPFGPPMGGGYPSPSFPQTNWWDPCETPLSCPRCRDLQLNGNDPWWCLDICLNRLPKWCFCWV